MVPGERVHGNLPAVESAGANLLHGNLVEPYRRLGEPLVDPEVVAEAPDEIFGHIVQTQVLRMVDLRNVVLEMVPDDEVLHKRAA